MAELTAISAGKIWLRWPAQTGATRYLLQVLDAVTGIPVAGRDTAPPKTAAALVAAFQPGRSYTASIRYRDTNGTIQPLAEGLTFWGLPCPNEGDVDRWVGSEWPVGHDHWADAGGVLYNVDESPAPGLYLRRAGISLRLADLTRSTPSQNVATLPDGRIAVLDRFTSPDTAALRLFQSNGAMLWERPFPGYWYIGALRLLSTGDFACVVMGRTHDAGGNQPMLVAIVRPDGAVSSALPIPLATVWPAGSNAYYPRAAIVEAGAGIHVFTKTDGAMWIDYRRFSLAGALLEAHPRLLASYDANGNVQDGPDGPDGELPALSAAVVGSEVWLAYQSTRTPAFSSEFFSFVGPYSKPPEDFGEWNAEREMVVCRVGSGGTKQFLATPARTERITCHSLSEHNGLVYLLYRRFNEVDQSFDEVYVTIWNGSAWSTPASLGPAVWSSVHCSAGRGVWQDPGGMRLVALPTIPGTPPPPPPPPAATAAPTFFPNGGKFRKQVTVTLSCATPGAVIYFTLDGTTPTAVSPQYTVPFVLTSDTRVQAMAQAPGLSASAVVSAFFDRKGNA